jgi:hypothetical protein
MEGEVPMRSKIQDFVMAHPLFDHHDHHNPFKDFEKNRARYDASSLLGYAGADIDTAAGARPGKQLREKERIATYWPKIRTTGYARCKPWMQGAV